MNNGVISNAVWAFISIGCFVIGMLVMVEISTEDCSQHECAITRPQQNCICMDCNESLEGKLVCEEEARNYAELYTEYAHEYEKLRRNCVYITNNEYEHQIHNLQLDLEVCEIDCNYRIERIYDRWNRSLIPIDWDNVVMTK